MDYTTKHEWTCTYGENCRNVTQLLALQGPWVYNFASTEATPEELASYIEQMEYRPVVQVFDPHTICAHIEKDGVLYQVWKENKHIYTLVGARQPDGTARVTGERRVITALKGKDKTLCLNVGSFTDHVKAIDETL